MKCRACQSTMLLDRCEAGSNATACWHRCPNCKTVRMTSELSDNSVRGNNMNDNKAYAMDAEFSGSYNESYIVA